MLAAGRASAPCIAAHTSRGGGAADRAACSHLAPPRSFLFPRPRELMQRLESRPTLGHCRRRGALQVSALAPKREMSLQQRWRAAKAVAVELRQQLGAALSALPPVAALLQLLALIDRKLQPLYALAALVKAAAVGLVDSYNNFLAEETKRRWNWENKHQPELDFWKSVPPFMFNFGVTVLYEVMMPVSVLAALVLPIYFAWVVWDDWWTSPVFLAALAMAPLKFVPWADICWIWPGLI